LSREKEIKEKSATEGNPLTTRGRKLRNRSKTYKKILNVDEDFDWGKGKGV